MIPWGAGRLLIGDILLEIMLELGAVCLVLNKDGDFKLNVVLRALYGVTVVCAHIDSHPAREGVGTSHQGKGHLGDALEPLFGASKIVCVS